MHRPKAAEDEAHKDGSDADSDFVDRESPQQSVDEASEEDPSDDSDFAAKKKPKQPARRLTARRGAARTGIYREPSSGDEADASSSGAASLHTKHTAGVSSVYRSVTGVHGTRRGRACMLRQRYSVLKS